MSLRSICSSTRPATSSSCQRERFHLRHLRTRLPHLSAKLDVMSGCSTKFPLAFGNFRRAYQIADRHDLRVTVDPYSVAGFTRFYVRRRAYAAPTDTNAVKFIKTAA